MKELHSHSHTVDPRIPDHEISIAPGYLAESFDQLRREIRAVANLLASAARRVDMYRVQTLAADSESNVTLLAQYDMRELITSILITGPAAATFTIKLGSRVWSTLVMPATGFMVIAPVAIQLDTSSDRQLIAGSAGDWSMELMGTADVRNRP